MLGPAPSNGARDKVHPEFRQGQCFFCPCRKEGAERSGVATAGSDVSFIEQIGGTRTETSRSREAMACFSPRCNLPQAPPSGSILSRAPISGATPFYSKLNASPKASRLCSENALDGASAAYLQIDPLNGPFFFVNSKAA